MTKKKPTAKVRKRAERIIEVRRTLEAVYAGAHGPYGGFKDFLDDTDCTYTVSMGSMETFMRFIGGVRNLAGEAGRDDVWPWTISAMSEWDKTIPRLAEWIVDTFEWEEKL